MEGGRGSCLDLNKHVSDADLCETLNAMLCDVTTVNLRVERSFNFSRLNVLFNAQEGTQI